ncbi:MAG: hypothetical protein J6S69_01490 [Proteobacteria bacterium]|nr:hypothetical protein [Pseudomonadota bacterium]
MKKILSLLALAGLALTGCVDDNPSVILNGLPMGECSPSGSDQQMWAAEICDPSVSPIAGVSYHLNNYITGEPPWSSSGGGSGTTFEPEIVNPGQIFLDAVVIKCDSVDGSAANCDGIEPITVSQGSPVAGGAGACGAFYLDIATIASWGTNVVIDISVKYHDASLIKGQSSHTKLPILFQSNGQACFYVASEDEGDNSGENNTPIE